jgi:molecular chaperone DnaK
VLVRPYDPAFFPFDPSLHDEDDLRRQPVGRRECGPDVEERYVVTPSGAVDVIITTPPTGLARTFQLARHAPASL